jgi:tryptophan synthase alpha chain
MADGPVIQRASERALQNGVTVAEILSTAAQARKQTDIPIVVFSYFNPLLQFGLERLAYEAAASGLDGVLVTDLPPEEAEEFSSILAAQGLDLIFLAAPTSTDERLRLISRLAHGFIYAVSRTGVTGTREDLSRDAAQLAERLRRISDLPIAVGFGISKAEHVADVWRFADAAVIGSALVAEIQRLSSTGVEASDPPAIARDIPRYAANFFRSLIPQHIAVGK